MKTIQVRPTIDNTKIEIYAHDLSIFLTPQQANILKGAISQCIIKCMTQGKCDGGWEYGGQNIDCYIKRNIR